MSEPLLLGIEIGGTKIQLCVGTAGGAIVARERFTVDLGRGADGIRDEIARRAPALCRRFDTRAVGAGFGGPVHSAAGRTITSHQVSGWDDFPLRDWLAERLGLPAHVENDSNLAGWAEYRLGAGRGTRCMVYANIGSGIGGCIVLGGALFNGQGFGAGEIGHTRVPFAGGGDEALERVASAWAFERRLRERYPMAPGAPLSELCGGDREAIDGARAAGAARRGDTFVLAAFREEAEAVGIALANVATLLCPEVIAVGGGLSLAGDVLFTPLAAALEARVIGAFRGAYRVVPAALGEDVVICGALLLAAGDVRVL
ncbi:MAG: ROK family protein [Planctomycetes bacterium]|nr:ROK family protein [Planctomycetota bacterium]